MKRKRIIFIIILLLAVLFIITGIIININLGKEKPKDDNNEIITPPEINNPILKEEALNLVTELYKDEESYFKMDDTETNDNYIIYKIDKETDSIILTIKINKNTRLISIDESLDDN